MVQTRIDCRDISLHTYVWETGLDAVGVIQIIHGSIEHAYRYRDFAEYMNKHGFHVVAPDMRGHGKSTEKLAFYSHERGGFKQLVEDAEEVTKWISKRYESLPITLLSHSMGTFVARAYLNKYPVHVRHAIISGTGYTSPLLLGTMIPYVKSRMKRMGADYRDQFLHNLAYNGFNGNVTHSDLGCAFISSDLSVVHAYDQDPLCGTTVTLDYLYEMMVGVKEVQRKSAYETRKDLPLLFFSGELDLVGGKGLAGVLKVVDNYRENGHNVTFKSYKNGRHEMLNEPNKYDVYKDIHEWIKSQ